MIYFVHDQGRTLRFLFLALAVLVALAIYLYNAKMKPSQEKPEDAVPPERSEVIKIGVWQGVKFGFGFALGMFIFGLVLWFVGLAVFGAVINSIVHSLPAAGLR